MSYKPVKIKKIAFQKNGKNGPSQFFELKKLKFFFFKISNFLHRHRFQVAESLTKQVKILFYRKL